MVKRHLAPQHTKASVNYCVESTNGMSDPVVFFAESKAVEYAADAGAKWHGLRRFIVRRIEGGKPAPRGRIIPAKEIPELRDPGVHSAAAAAVAYDALINDLDTKDAEVHELIK